jgi:hypothetical protein
VIHFILLENNHSRSLAHNGHDARGDVFSKHVFRMHGDVAVFLVSFSFARSITYAAIALVFFNSAADEGLSVSGVQCSLHHSRLVRLRAVRVHPGNKHRLPPP